MKNKILDELKPKNIKFKVDRWEELVLQDLSTFDEDTKIKLNRDLTKDFNNWINDKLKAKEQLKINIKGETRSGKSLVGLKIVYLSTKFYKNKKYEIEKIVCANQKELRTKLNTAIFGDSFLIDENAFSNVGVGSMSELQQLKDINNIIAKQNIHMVYITPQTFLNTGATLGLAYFGKDTNNWLSRFLLYSLKNNMPQLLGYVVFNVGALFSDNDCLIYKQLGGCTNPNKISLKEIDKNYLKYSDCIFDKDFNSEKLIHTKQVCPFYDVCNNPMSLYEHKKDLWIKREMSGGLGEREVEKLEVSLKLYKSLVIIDENNNIKLNAKNGKELKLKIKMKLPTIINTKYTGTEIEEIIQTIISLNNLDFFKDVCKSINKDFKIEYENIFKK